MPSDLETLQIKPEEIENLISLDISTMLAVDISRVFILRNHKRLFSVLLTELFIFILILIIVLPVILIVLRASGNIPKDPVGINQLLAILLGISLLGMLGLTGKASWQSFKSSFRFF